MALVLGINAVGAKAEAEKVERADLHKSSKATK